MRLATDKVARNVMVEQSLSFTLPTANEDWPLYRRLMPSTPVNCACVMNWKGSVDGREMPSPNTIIQHHGFRLVLRCSDYNVGWQKASTATQHLSVLKNVSVTVDAETVLVDTVIRNSPVMSLGYEGGYGGTMKKGARNYLLAIDFLLVADIV